MSKFSSEEKIKAVILYLNGNESQRTVAELIGVNRAVFQTWVQQYQSHGEKAFEKNYTSYTGQYKLDVLNYMNNHGTSPNETAAFFNISSPSLIRKWRRISRNRRPSN